MRKISISTPKNESLNCDFEVEDYIAEAVLILLMAMMADKNEKREIIRSG